MTKFALAAIPTASPVQTLSVSLIAANPQSECPQAAPPVAARVLGQVAAPKTCTLT
eukprot:m.79130 g.79130  ORF g.79130 m.79130 type:complete len:56 (-) comp10777_c0_seq3:499-666(-)